MELAEDHHISSATTTTGGVGEFSLGEDLYVSNSLMWEVIIRMVLIPMVLLFLAHRYLLSGRLIEIREGTHDVQVPGDQLGDGSKYRGRRGGPDGNDEGLL